jgi:hypothetical protein
MPIFKQVAAGTDDAYENDNNLDFNTNASPLKMDAHPTVANERYNAGFRFTSIAIAQGATIQNAYLQLYVPNVAQDDPLMTVSAHDVDDAADFTGGGADVTARVGSRTTATVAVSAGSVGVGWYLIPGLTAVIQEIVDRVGWASGQAMVILCEGGDGGSQDFYARGYAGNASQAAKLAITVGAADPLDVAEAYRRGGVHARFAPML